MGTTPHPSLHRETRFDTFHQSLLIVGEQPLTLATGKLCIRERPVLASPVKGASWSDWVGEEGNDDLHPTTPQRPSHARRSSSSVEQRRRKNHRPTAPTAPLASKKLTEAPSTAPHHRSILMVNRPTTPNPGRGERDGTSWPPVAPNFIKANQNAYTYMYAKI
jgi:hypothetical protein